MKSHIEDTDVHWVVMCGDTPYAVGDTRGHAEKLVAKFALEHADENIGDSPHNRCWVKKVYTRRMGGDQT